MKWKFHKFLSISNLESEIYIKSFHIKLHIFRLSRSNIYNISIEIEEIAHHEILYYSYKTSQSKLRIVVFCMLSAPFTIFPHFSHLLIHRRIKLKERENFITFSICAECLSENWKLKTMMTMSENWKFDDFGILPRICVNLLINICE